MFYLTTHSTHFIVLKPALRCEPSTYQSISYWSMLASLTWKEENVIFNDALNTFYSRLYSVIHMEKEHSDSERGNPLPPHGLFFPISSMCSFICTIQQTG